MQEIVERVLGLARENGAIDFTARSDLDFLVEFDPMPPGEYAEAFFGLR